MACICSFICDMIFLKNFHKNTDFKCQVCVGVCGSGCGCVCVCVWRGV